MRLHWNRHQINSDICKKPTMGNVCRCAYKNGERVWFRHFLKNTKKNHSEKSSSPSHSSTEIKNRLFWSKLVRDECHFSATLPKKHIGMRWISSFVDPPRKCSLILLIKYGQTTWEAYYVETVQPVWENQPCFLFLQWPSRTIWKLLNLMFACLNDF